VAKQILQDINGVARQGKLLAIMGPSGAGKTSLLDILAGRRLQSSGELTLGTQNDVSPAEIRRRSAYVQQDDAIMASQTVREAITMAALLTLPRNMPKDEKIRRAEATMKTFSLEDCAETLVGDPVGRLKGISGGERKRCAVAMNSVHEPSMMFLDEPTSGLDAHKALVLVQVLRDTAGQGSTVVCTIHQPSSDIYTLFDDFLLLLDGRIVFNASAEKAVGHFGNAGYPCPQYANPADFFFMHVLVDSSGTVAHGERKDHLVTSWIDSELKKEMDATVQEQIKDAKVGLSDSSTQQMASPLLQFQVLLKRCAFDVKRNPMRGKAVLGQSVVFALIIALIWNKVPNDMKGVQDRVGAMFFMCANGLMTNVMNVLTNFANERGAVVREQQNNLYKTGPYFMARVIVDIPIRLLGPFLFATISYWALGFQNDGVKYLICVIILILLALAGNAMGLFLACIFTDVSIALAVAPMVILPLMMVSGFFLNPDSFPVYLKWAQWLSPMKYAFSALAANEFSGLPLECLDDQKKTFVKNGQTVVVCPFADGDAYLDTLNIQKWLTITNCCVMLAVLMVSFTALAYITLSTLSWRMGARPQVRKSKQSASGTPKEAAALDASAV
jgi:ABC-type multidrug transport system ATPase subunit